MAVQPGWHQPTPSGGFAPRSWQTSFAWHPMIVPDGVISQSGRQMADPLPEAGSQSPSPGMLSPPQGAIPCEGSAAVHVETHTPVG